MSHILSAPNSDRLELRRLRGCAETPDQAEDVESRSSLRATESSHVRPGRHLCTAETYKDHIKMTLSRPHRQ